MRTDILERLRIDPGNADARRFFQDREAAIHEIGQLRLRSRVPSRAKARNRETEPAALTAQPRKAH